MFGPVSDWCQLLCLWLMAHPPGPVLWSPGKACMVEQKSVCLPGAVERHQVRTKSRGFGDKQRGCVSVTGSSRVRMLEVASRATVSDGAFLRTPWVPSQLRHKEEPPNLHNGETGRGRASDRVHSVQCCQGSDFCSTSQPCFLSGPASFSADLFLRGGRESFTSQTPSHLRI